MNKEVINLAVKAGLAFNCKINNVSFFERKHYFYPDLPAGYQVSQLEKPICVGGYVDIELDDGTIKRIRLNRIHIEEDAGKLVHIGAPGVWGAKASAVDYNRTSIPLIEIVAEPDFRTAKEAKEYVATLRTTLLNLGICDGNLEEGSIRCDANISIKPRNQKEFGTKTEIKNMNSFKAIEKAIEHEIERQKKVIKNGGEVIQQTRLWDDSSQKTIAMRNKETAMDYRYFRDPIIAPLVVSDELINEIKKTIIPSPLERKKKYQEELKISSVEATQLVENPLYSKYFDGVLKFYNNAKNIANWFFNEILSFVNGDAEKIHITYEDFAKFLKRIDDGEISGKIGKEVIAKAFDKKAALNDIIDSEGLRQISDTKEIEKIIDEFVITMKDKIEEYKNGNEKLFGFFVGEIMKKTKGKANPKIINELLKRKIK
jgi:aspartyl-tRNA(Asn)/glutamyl-tRNA(Gln) amidotransferase subunit B